MASTLRIKKRAASGAAGAPSSLASSELAFNENDKKLYYGFGDNGSAEASSIITIGGNGAFCDLTTTQTVAGAKTFSDNVVVTGNLTVNGTTTTVNSTTTTVDDPVFTIGGDSSPGSDDNKDRGIEFKWHNGSTAKVGFFGFDDSTGKFTFIPDATNSSEVFSGTAGTLVADLEGTVTGTSTGLAGTPNITVGTVAASSLDISGDADIDGTLEADAYTVNGTALNTYITGITVTNATTAATGTEVTVSANNSTNETVYPVFVDGTTGSQGIESDSGFTYNPSSGLLTIGGELDAASLDISGDADIDGTLEADAITVNGTALSSVIAGTTVTTATNATHVVLTDNESTNENNVIPFGENASATGNVGLETDGDFHYNPSTGTCTATYFAGTIDGGTW